MNFSWLKYVAVALLFLALLFAGGIFILAKNKTLFFKPVAVLGAIKSVGQSTVKNLPLPPPPAQKLINPPAVIKAVYVTGYSASSKKYLEYLTTLFDKTEILIKNIDALVNFFHSKHIYVIGRISTFEDPMYAKARPDIALYNTAKTTDLSKPVLWKNKDGLAWLDPASEDAWAYNVSLAKDAYYHGFDEVNFDHVRFPTDGDTSTMGFPKWDGKTPLQTILKSFFVYLKTNLPGQKISIDVFGQTTVSKDDMGIGQLLENELPSVDYIAPMVYPSHYINGFMGFANPADHPYEVVKYNLDTALAREQKYYANQQLATNQSAAPESQAQAVKTDLSESGLAKFRPWLQDFNLGAYYTPEMVEQEIKATQDALGSDYNGFMLWNPSNIYTQGAILKPN